MSDVRDRYARLFRRGDGTDRIQFFSDAVFAIALTLLVLDIRLPDDADVAAGLVELVPQFFGFALSFVIIALNWMSHHAKYRVIVRFTPRLIQLNFLVLFAVAFVPFPTSVLAEHGDTPSVVLYAASMAALSLSQLLVWAYASRAGLVSSEVDPGVSRYVVLNILPAPLVFLASIPVAFVSAQAAMWSWFAIIPVSLVLSAVSRRTGT